MKNSKEKRSPLKDKPLRYAGQSLDEQIEDKRTDALTNILVVALFISILITDWLRYLFPPKQLTSPILATIIVLSISFYCIYKIYRLWKEINQLKMARDGEKIVGEELQTLIKEGATIFHDVVGDQFNIDHIVVSKRGVFVIETKTYSKPIRKDTQITFDEHDVYVDNYKIEREPIKQAKSLSKWLQDLLLQTTGKKFAIRPVILFPGWYTEKIKKGQEVWILNPKALPVFIAHEPPTLEDSDVHLIAYHLSRYVRTH